MSNRGALGQLDWRLSVAKNEFQKSPMSLCKQEQNDQKMQNKGLGVERNLKIALDTHVSS
jgi:hypothetical protein